MPELLVIVKFKGGDHIKGVIVQEDNTGIEFIAKERQGDTEEIKHHQPTWKCRELFIPWEAIEYIQYKVYKTAMGKPAKKGGN